jgi:diguanylate cyclase (GGDEF)-like protein/PAS domain S-box-containing protein
MLKVFACVTEQHDLSLLVLAALVALFGSTAAIGLLRRAVAASDRLRVAWLAGAAVAFGSGMWATHFIALLAWLPASGFGFAVPRIAASLLVAIFGSLAAFTAALQGRPAGWGTVLGGVMLAGTIAALHFVGMAALPAAALVMFRPAYVGGALAVGIVFAVPALWAVRRRHLIAAVVLSMLAICGLHVTAMTGTLVVPGGAAAGGMSGGLLAVAVAGVTALTLMLALICGVLDRHLALRRQAEAGRLRRFADATFEGILFLRNGRVIDANATVCALLDQDRADVLGLHVERLLALPFCPESAPPGHAAEAELLRADGERRPVEVLCRRLGGTTPNDCVLAVRDLTDRKLAEQRIQHLAHHDSLTGLPNRRLFQDRLAQAVSIAERSGHGLAVLSLDLDGFRAVNETLGHPGGDAVLVEVGNRLAACLRESDTVARLDGDAFAIVQSFGDQPRGAAGLAERILRLLAEPIDVAGQRTTIGASIGVALFPSDAQAPDMLLRNADLALARVKQEGRGMFRFFEPDMDARLRLRSRLEHDLRGAMLRRELRLHYQPLLDSTTLAIEGFEALLRWEHPERGFISPAEFVPVAEECGLIGALGQWVLETACAEAASWSRPWRVAVNLSPAQFHQRHLAATIRAILNQAGLAPSRLELEITEGILIDDAERALATLRELKALGVRIALDDFGTGYSSLSYLRRFPFDKLKIDASFVQALGDGGEADAIVRAIVALGRSLSLHITAEGVETPEQLRLLRAQDCDEVQGFLLGRPLPATALTAMGAGVAEPAPA